MESIKAIVIGDTGVGKTAMLLKFVQDYFPGEHIPTVFDVYNIGMLCENQLVKLSLWDLGGDRKELSLKNIQNRAIKSMAVRMMQKRSSQLKFSIRNITNNLHDHIIGLIVEYAIEVNLQQVVYPRTDVFILCHSLADPSSLQNLVRFWGPEVKELCPGVPLFMIGLRNREIIQDGKEAHLEAIEAVKKCLGVSGSFKSSSKFRNSSSSIAEIFKEISSSVLKSRRKQFQKSIQVHT
mmetsp:Transcript_4063/g.5834  ORF Transcript_4063/g.5834 Transcript_4063/m.5834 type:complete len:237 (-) Transcript_4063:214-924(-)|eukprot:CAMPEP_0184492972 /NCGR_PEP_ID=MMETSP0113_2-20130426/24740_1 /TAXON_ID=91329 /ORGANISM="Norrisiella sphaerica, Strain BC52" /LENGTH=236 /DNA_ID=CAMNT_0026878043 /DNA_START=23 /DNA_END=733 /DNA_ORIENTATION=+